MIEESWPPMALFIALDVERHMSEQEQQSNVDFDTSMLFLFPDMDEDAEMSLNITLLEGQLSQQIKNNFSYKYETTRLRTVK